jgi:tetratricopeptide (TPR) repeat protein
MPLLTICGLAGVLVLQPPAPARSPYLDVVRAYGPGTEREAILALDALRLRDADQVFAELDDTIARRESPANALATWRRLYPRALALHVEALAACDPTADLAAMRLHLNVLLRLVVRIEQVARDQRAPAFARVATQGRHLTLWVLQYLREEGGLATAVETFEAAKGRAFTSGNGVAPREDVDVRLARGALEELRASPDAVAQEVRGRELFHTFDRDNMIARAERRRLETAARVYDMLVVDHPAELEAHPRLARLLLRLGQPAKAEAHLTRVAELKPDARQAYLAALFLADAHERQGRGTDAIAAYDVAQRHWPGAQSPAIGMARLRSLSGSHMDARVALTAVHLDRAVDAPERSDPWMGYGSAQAWRLPSGIAALQASFEAEP